MPFFFNAFNFIMLCILCSEASGLKKLEFPLDSYLKFY